MSQATLKEQPVTDKISGLDQSMSPTISVATQVFSIRGAFERNNVLQRLPGKVAELKKSGDVFHIHFLPDGTYIYHSYGVGIVWVH